LPKTADGPAKTIERCRGFTAPCACAMTPLPSEPSAHGLKQRMQERASKDRGKGTHQEPCDPMVPFPEPRTFSASCTVVGAKCQFDVPSPWRRPAIIRHPSGQEVTGVCVTTYREAPEQLLFHLALGGRVLAFATPPRHGHDGGSVLESGKQHACPFDPSHHELLARLELTQALCCAGTRPRTAPANCSLCAFSTTLPLTLEPSVSLGHTAEPGNLLPSLCRVWSHAVSLRRSLSFESALTLQDDSW
jgi:hypothetical protein